MSLKRLLCLFVSLIDKCQGLCLQKQSVEITPCLFRLFTWHDSYLHTTTKQRL